MDRTNDRPRRRAERVATLALTAALSLLEVLARRPTTAAEARDDAGAREAFLAAYNVFMHPRCMNCHPATRPGTCRHPG